MSKRYTKATLHQVRQALRSITRESSPDNIKTVEELLEWYNEQGYISAPGNIYHFIVNRPLVLGEVLTPRHNTLLTNYLDSYPEHTFIVMDAIQSGKDALYLVQLEECVERMVTSEMWLKQMQQDKHMVINHYKTDIIVAARVKSFVPKINL